MKTQKILILTMLLCLIGLAVACEKKITDAKKDYDKEQNSDTVTHYIIGYNTGCGSIDAIDTANGIGKSNVGVFLAVSSDLKDTLAIFDFPDDLFIFSSEILYPIGCVGYILFPEEYRLKYGIRMEYKLDENLEFPCQAFLPSCNSIWAKTASIISISAAGGS